MKTIFAIMGGGLINGRYNLRSLHGDGQISARFPDVVEWQGPYGRAHTSLTRTFRHGARVSEVSETILVSKASLRKSSRKTRVFSTNAPH